MSSNTSVGRGPAGGGNENHDGDPRNKTLGEAVKQEPPAGNPLLDEAAPEVPAVVPVSAPDSGSGMDSQALAAPRGKRPPR